MDTLFNFDKDNKLNSIGGIYSVKILEAPKRVQIFYFDKLLKEVPIALKLDFRIFVVTDLLPLQGIKKELIHKAFGISRQSIDNWEDNYHKYGVAGLMNSSKPVLTGNKARQLEDERKEERDKNASQQLEFNFSYNRDGGQQYIEPEDTPFQEETDWKQTRYAGIMLYQATLGSVWRWYELIIGYLGTNYKILMVFLLMSARNIRSITQLKNARKDEAGSILGFKDIPSLPGVWSWFYTACDEKIATPLLTEFCGYQIETGIVGIDRWYSDGHNYYYTGYHNIHYTFSTQRGIPLPGRTNTVTCDSNGNIVDFVIEEGKGDLRSVVLNLDEKWLNYTVDSPIKVFDREGYDANFFWDMKQSGNSFVTWLKNIDTAKLNAIADEKFDVEFKFNVKDYAVFEQDRIFKTKPAADGEGFTPEVQEFTLREIFIWNKTCKRRTCGIAYTANNNLSTEECAKIILDRWGVSENTFKHAQTRHPFNYQPGFKMTKSEKQDIENPLLKEKKKEKKKLTTTINRLYKLVTNTVASLKKNGDPRANCKKAKIQNELNENKKQEDDLKLKISQLPDRVDVTTLEDYHSFKKIDNEGKYLFDFVTASVWNARNMMVDWLKPFYSTQNDIVDLFYAITNCQGWVKVTEKEVRVRLEPLQQSGRRAAQRQLCRKITSLGSQTPNGKYIVIEVGESPQ